MSIENFLWYTLGLVTRIQDDDELRAQILEDLTDLVIIYDADTDSELVRLLGWLEGFLRFSNDIKVVKDKLSQSL